MTTRELERLLDLLAKLSEQTAANEGKLRDDIARVRAEVWGRLEQGDKDA